MYVCVSVWVMPCVCWCLWGQEEGRNYKHLAAASPRPWQQALRTSEAQCPPPHYTSWTIFSGGCYVVPLFWRLWRFILVNYFFLTLHTLFLKRKHTFLHSYFNHLKFFYPSPILPSIHPKTSVSEIGGMGEGRLTMAYWRSDSGVSLFTSSLLVNADAKLTYPVTTGKGGNFQHKGFPICLPQASFFTPLGQARA